MGLPANRSRGQAQQSARRSSGGMRRPAPMILPQPHIAKVSTAPAARCGSSARRSGGGTRRIDTVAYNARRLLK